MSGFASPPAEESPDAQLDTDRSTASERVPVHGAYNITDLGDGTYNITGVGDSLRVGWWEGERGRVIKWGNLRWWAFAATVVAAAVWAVLSSIPLPILLIGGGLCAFLVVKAFVWYVELADRHAEMRLKRRQAGIGRSRGWQQ